MSEDKREASFIERLRKAYTDKLTKKEVEQDRQAVSRQSRPDNDLVESFVRASARRMAIADLEAHQNLHRVPASWSPFGSDSGIERQIGDAYVAVSVNVRIDVDNDRKVVTFDVAVAPNRYAATDRVVERGFESIDAAIMWAELHAADIARRWSTASDGAATDRMDARGFWP